MHRFFPVTRLPFGKVDSTIAEVEAVIAAGRLTELPRVPNDVPGMLAMSRRFRTVHRITGVQVLVFRALWAHNIPLVVTGADKRLRASWSPEGLAKLYGEHNVTVLDSRHSRPRKTTAREFFEELSRDDREYEIKLKVSVTRGILVTYSLLRHTTRTGPRRRRSKRIFPITSMTSCRQCRCRSIRATTVLRTLPPTSHPLLLRASRSSQT